MGKGISFYPVERAEKILDLYFENSGHSKSRTIEEIILSYHNLYQVIYSLPEVDDEPQLKLIIQILKQNFRVTPARVEGNS